MTVRKGKKYIKEVKLFGKNFKGSYLYGDIVTYKDSLYSVIKETKQYVRLYDRDKNNGFNTLKYLVSFVARPLFPK